MSGSPDNAEPELSVAEMNDLIVSQIDMPAYLISELEEFKKESDKIDKIQVCLSNCDSWTPTCFL